MRTAVVCIEAVEEHGRVLVAVGPHVAGLVDLEARDACVRMVVCGMCMTHDHTYGHSYVLARESVVGGSPGRLHAHGRVRGVRHVYDS